ncbi:MAG: L,D-transpeptidase [Holophagaceae bacterium]|nr:L,D-transpeptidase [Holophagaceae bacterium]
MEFHQTFPEGPPAQALSHFQGRNPLRLLCLCLVLVLASCDRRRSEKPIPAPAPSSHAPVKPKAGPRFRSYRITTTKELLKLRDSMGAQRFDEALKLNRIDLRHAREGDNLVLPESAEDWLALAPFPSTWKALEDQPKLITVSLRLQAWAAYEAGRMVRWGPVSSGRKASPTFTGLYHTNWCQKERRSTFNDEWQLKWYINLHNWNGISFHQYELPGYPDSHACLRLAADDSEWIYRWCQSWILAPDERTVLREGTPVVVFGDYAWGAPGPWKRIMDEPEAGGLKPEELAQAFRIFQGKVAPLQAIE